MPDHAGAPLALKLAAAGGLLFLHLPLLLILLYAFTTEDKSYQFLPPGLRGGIPADRAIRRWEPRRSADHHRNPQRAQPLRMSECRLVERPVKMRRAPKGSVLIHR